MKRNRRRFLAKMLVALLTIGGVSIAAGPVQAEPPTDYSSNLLGWANGAGWGNKGIHASTNWLWDVIVYLDAYGYELPLTLETQETCWSYLDGNPNSQFRLLYNRLVYVSGGTYVSGFWIEDVDTGKQAQACDLHGNAVIARANSTTATWASHLYVPLAEAPNPNHDRGMVCIHPTLWVVNHAACSLHITTDPNFQQSQLDTAYFAFLGINTSYKFFSGDFNLENVTRSLSSEATAGQDTYPTFSGPSPRKIDYIFFRNGGWVKRQQGTVLLPRVCQSLECVPLQNHRVSDHYTVLGYVGS